MYFKKAFITKARKMNRYIETLYFYDQTRDKNCICSVDIEKAIQRGRKIRSRELHRVFLSRRKSIVKLLWSLSCALKQCLSMFQTLKGVK